MKTRDNFSVGHRQPRIDAIEKVTGQALYGDDLRFPGLLYAKALRSPYPHARILNIDSAKARRLPGVIAVVDGRNLPYLGGEAIMDYPFLASDRVRYVGDAVVAVAAVDEATAEEALDLIEVEYEELPAIFDAVEAMQPGAPLVHENLSKYERLPVIKVLENSNVCGKAEFCKGDVERGFAESDLIVENTFTTQMVQHAAIEPHTAVAQVSAAGDVTVWVTNDGPHRLRKDLASAMKLPLKKVRVICPPYMGGGFGSKGGLKVETICIALAQQTNGRPVRMTLTREEVFTSTCVRHPSTVTLKTGVKRDGSFCARQVKVVYNTGAYAEKGPTVCLQASTAALGPYKIPNIRVDGYCVYTNNPIAGAYRGYGIPQVAWAHETQMDIIAERLGMSPTEIRMKNIVREGDVSPTGQQVLYSVGVEDCMREVNARVDWKAPKKRYVGRGLACAYKNTKTPSGSSAAVKINHDGSVELLTSTVEIGQGAKTILAQVVAEELSVPVEKITVSSADTALTPYDASTTSSRSTFHMGNAVKNAADDARRQAFILAGEMLSVNHDNLRLEQGRIFDPERPERGVTLEEVVKYKCRSGIDLIGQGSFFPPKEKVSVGPWSEPSIFWMYGAHFVELEVDPETGQVTILKIIGAHDVGKALNPTTCEGQIEGGIVHGMSLALHEEMKLNKGVVLNAGFTDYKLATAMDIPEIVPLLVEAPHKLGPLGAKGLGEMTNTPIAPAIGNALYDAIGVRFYDLPLTQEKILRALKNKASEPQPDERVYAATSGEKSL
jgi:carbon-monoxide dehydrogenase large subunit